MSKSGGEIRSELRKRSNSNPNFIGSTWVILSEEARTQSSSEPWLGPIDILFYRPS
jgi:hypothetical protein